MKSYLFCFLRIALLALAVSFVTACATGPNVPPDKAARNLAAFRIGTTAASTIYVKVKPEREAVLMALAAEVQTLAAETEITPEAVAGFVLRFATKNKLTTEEANSLASLLSQLFGDFAALTGKRVVSLSDPVAKEYLDAFATGIRSGVAIGALTK